jgi:hypothetical protein
MPRPICVFVIREHKLRRVPHSKPANIASTVDAANSCAKAPVKTGGRPAFRRIRINDRRNSAAVKGEFYFWLLIVKRSITAPGPLELHLVDSSAEFCNEPLHRDHLIYHPKQRALRELTTPMRETMPSSVRRCHCARTIPADRCWRRRWVYLLRENIGPLIQSRETRF